LCIQEQWRNPGIFKTENKIKLALNVKGWLLHSLGKAPGAHGIETGRLQDASENFTVKSITYDWN
jgi:hypothetical protein